MTHLLKEHTKIAYQNYLNSHKHDLHQFVPTEYHPFKVEVLEIEEITSKFNHCTAKNLVTLKIEPCHESSINSCKNNTTNKNTEIVANTFWKLPELPISVPIQSITNLFKDCYRSPLNSLSNKKILKIQVLFIKTFSPQEIKERAKIIDLFYQNKLIHAESSTYTSSFFKPIHEFKDHYFQHEVINCGSELVANNSKLFNTGLIMRKSKVQHKYSIDLDALKIQIYLKLTNNKISNLINNPVTLHDITTMCKIKILDVYPKFKQSLLNLALQQAESILNNSFNYEIIQYLNILYAGEHKTAGSVELVDLVFEKLFIKREKNQEIRLDLILHFRSCFGGKLTRYFAD